MVKKTFVFILSVAAISLLISSTAFSQVDPLVKIRRLNNKMSAMQKRMSYMEGRYASLSATVASNGANGKDGKDGANGKDGLNGRDGVNGTNGTNGKDGLNGANGIDGKDGAKGMDALGIKFLPSPITALNTETNMTAFQEINVTGTIPDSATAVLVRAGCFVANNNAGATAGMVFAKANDAFAPVEIVYCQSLPAFWGQRDVGSAIIPVDVTTVEDPVTKATVKKVSFKAQASYSNLQSTTQFSAYLLIEGYL